MSRPTASTDATDATDATEGRREPDIPAMAIDWLSPGIDAPGAREIAGEQTTRLHRQRLKVMLLATTQTKPDEIKYLVEALADNGVHAHVHDVSLNAAGRQLAGLEKIAAMQRRSAEIVTQIGPLIGPSYQAVVGLGGGTGGQIAIDVMRALPFSYPKVLVTTLPFDPRSMLADNSIVIVPTLADIVGLNATLRQSLDNAAAIVAGICRNPRRRSHVSEAPSIGVTALSTTAGGVDPLCRLIRQSGREATVFHSNGFGGAAFARWCDAGAFEGVVDFTVHELTRINVAGPHADMPRRFCAAAEQGLPQIVLPGAINIIGLGEIDYVPKRYLERPHYSHSKLFTHVKVTEDEMRTCARALGRHLLLSAAPVQLIVPMGGFSSEDAPDGAVFDEKLREIFLESVRDLVKDVVPITIIEDHINSENCAAAAFQALREHLD